MSENIRYGIAIGCGLILFIVLFVSVFLKGKSREEKIKEQAKKNGCVTKGNSFSQKTTYGKFTGPDGRYSCKTVIYEYCVDGKMYKRKVTFSSTGIMVQYPYEVEIFYKKSNPSISVADVEVSKERKKQSGCYIAIIVPILAVILIYNLLKLI